ncbi:MAG TPA: chain length determinant protein EpsF [Burkholderiaceae bacterium]|nr:chain length determinant protein EpsF [Burkholderiaceae bacterium]
MSITQLMTILQARWRLAAATLLVTVAATVAVSLVFPKRYTATAQVLVDIKTPDPILGQVFPGMMSPSYMGTQVDVITSDRVARHVVRALKLDQSAAMRHAWREDTHGAGEFAAWLAKLLQSSLDVKPSRESNVLSLSFKSVDPRFAATLANAFAQAYIDTTLELRVEPARQYNSFFDERAKQLREALEQAQSRLSAFQQSRGIIATDERQDVENARLAELSSQLVALQAVATESQNRQAQARQSPDQLQDVMTNPVVASLRQDLARQEVRLEEVGAKLGERHPQVIEIQANLAELKAKLRQEVERVSSSVGINNQINQAREAQLRASLAQQRAKVLHLKEVRDEQTVLVRDVENAQRAYDAVFGRMAQTQLESQTTQTNVVLLNTAAEPTEASSPRLRINALVAVFVGTLLGVGLALLREWLDRRVRSREDLTVSLDLPVLGALPSSRPRRRWFGRDARSPLQKRLFGQLPSALAGRT